MNFIIICLSCCALILAVAYLARRHMQKVRQTCDATSEKEHVSISDLEVVARSCNAQRRYDAESQRTRRIAICSIAIIIVVGAAVAVFDSYKKELLDGWFAMFAKQNTEKVETVENSDGKPLSTPVSEYKFSDCNYWETYFSNEQSFAALTAERMETEYNSKETVVEKKQEASDKKQYNSKVVEKAETLDNRLSFWNWLAAQFSYEKALEYYGAKRIVAVKDAEAEYKKCEEALKQAQKNSDDVKILTCRISLNAAKANLSETKSDLEIFDEFMHDWKHYLKLNWLILALLLVGGLDLYVELKNYEGVWESRGAFLSFLATVAGVGWPAFLVLNVYQCGVIFTIKDFIGIILTLWCFCFPMRHISFED